MRIEKHDALALRSEQDLVAVRREVKAWSAALGFSLVDQTKIVTASSEIGRNTVIYGGGGTALLEMVSDGMRRGLRVTFRDEGPGIPDISKAMEDGYTGGKGMGLGMSGAKRLVNEFTVASETGKGTTVAITRWK